MRRRRERSLSEFAYKQLRRQIIFQDLEPGQTVDLASLARELKVGRTPIREAVQRLAQEGLVRVLPRKGILVSEMSVDTLRQVFEARAPVEEQVARCAAMHAEPAHLERMREALSSVERLIQEKQFRALVEADEHFHVSLAQAAKNPLLRGMLATLYGLAIRFWYVTLPQRPAEDIKKEMALHVQVLEAVQQADCDKAAKAMLKIVGGFPHRVAGIWTGAVHPRT